MPTWLPYQRERLALERNILRQELPDFEIREPLGDTHVVGSWRSNQGNWYTIRIQIPDGYPDECPATFIDKPLPLLDFWGRPMTRHSASHEYHTLMPDDGIVQICTYREERWNASATFVQLVHKAFLWIVAYEEHRQHGTKIQDLLLDMK